MADPAASTIAALDAMEQNLHRLGLGHEGAADPLKGQTTETSAGAYMNSIRGAQDTRRKLRVEKEYRQYITSQQQNRNEQMLSSAAEARSIQALVDEAPKQLQAEAEQANSIVNDRANAAVEKDLREENVAKQQFLQKLLLGHRTTSQATLGGGDSIMEENAETILGSAAATAKRTMKKQLTHELFARFAKGLVELAMEVSDNHYLSATDMEGKPVRRIRQDLAVSDWNRWTEEYLWTPWNHTADFQKEETVVDEAAMASAAEAALEAQRQQDALDLKEQSIAESHLMYTAEQQRLHQLQMEKTSVQYCLDHIISDEERSTRVLLDNIRRQYDEEMELVDPETVRQEAFPGWTQRAPPSGCFIFGDELSGARLLCDNAERSYHQQRRASAAADGGGGTATTTSPLHSKNQSSTYLLNTWRADNGVQKVLLTPRILQGTPGRSHSATRIRTGGAGGKAATLRRASTDDDDRREMESLVEALCKELVNTHVHNLHVLTNGQTPAVLPSCSVPAVPDHAPKQQRSQGTTPRGAATKGSNAAAPEAPSTPTVKTVPTLRSLLLLGFPQTEAFFKTLQQRLDAAVEAAEIEILEDQYRIAMSASELLDAKTQTKGGKKSTSPQTARQQRNSVLKGGPNRQTSEEVIRSLQAKHALPPMCVLGYFIECDLPTRQQRLSETYVLGDGTMHHAVFNPESSMTGNSTSATTPHKEEQSSSGRSGGASAAAVSAFKKLIRREPERNLSWDVARMRTELLEQNRTMQRWHTQWTSVFSCVAPPADAQQADANAAATAPTAAANAAPAPGGKEKGGRRREKRGSPRTSHNTAEQAPPALGTVDGKQEEAAAAIRFPRVLFFQRQEDLSSMQESENSTLASPEESFGSLSANSLLGRQRERDKAKWVEFMLGRIAEAVRPSGRLFSSDTLIPDQLPAPLRLNDYRLPPQVCAKLVQCLRDIIATPITPTVAAASAAASHNAASDAPHTNGESPLTAGDDSHANTPVADSHNTTTAEVLRAEVEVYRAFTQHTQLVFQVLQEDAFTGGLWGKSTEVEFNNTGHFSSIDHNYKKCKQRILDVTRTFRRQLHVRCNTWLRLTIEDALQSTAAALMDLCKRIQKHYAPTAQAVLAAAAAAAPAVASPTAAAAAAAASAAGTTAEASANATQEGEEGSMHTVAAAAHAHPVDPPPVTLPRLNEKDIKDLLDKFITRPSPEQQRAAMEAFWACIDPYLASVQTTCEDYLLRFVDTVDLSASTRPPLDWTVHVPRLAKTVLSHTFALTCENEPTEDTMSSLWPYFPMDDKHEAMGTASVSPYFARCSIVLQDILSCFLDSEARGLDWLEALYCVAVDTPICGTFSEDCRPLSIDEMFQHPAPILKKRCGITCTKQEEVPSGLPSTWARMHMQLLLTSLAIYNRPMLRPQELLHATLLAGLCQLWEYVNDNTTPEKLRLPRSVSPNLVSATMGHFKHLAHISCRPENSALFSIREVQSLIAHSMGQYKLPDGVLLDAQVFYLRVTLRRCCFCDETEMSLPCIWQSPWVAPEPSARELRRAVLELPRYVRDQSDLEEVVPLVPSVEQLMTGMWQPFVPPLPTPVDPTPSCARVLDDGTLPWCVLQGLTSCYRVSKRGVLRKAYPPLPRIISFFAASRGGLVDATVERMFHAIAALRYARGRESNPHLNPDAVTAWDADDVQLTVDEFCYYFSTFGSHADISLKDDATIFTRVEKVNYLTLPGLLSSHWGKALLHDQKPH